jgi:outer membrane immunogenic protein
MTKFFLTTIALVAWVPAAFAADLPARVPMPVKAQPYMAPVLFSWTGCYVGVEGGGNWGRSSQTAAANTPIAGTPITGNFNMSGGIAGGTVGCNYQVSNIVVGIENDYSWTNKSGSAAGLPPTFAATTLSTTREKWIDTLRGRVGFAWDRFLVYGTAGAAFAGTSVSVADPAFGTLTNSQNRTGWTAGVGGEWAVLADTWGAVSLKLEYLHADFGTKQYFNPSVVTAAGTTVVTRDVKLSDDMIRGGVNVKFNWDGPSVPHY